MAKYELITTDKRVKCAPGNTRCDKIEIDTTVLGPGSYKVAAIGGPGFYEMSSEKQFDVVYDCREVLSLVNSFMEPFI